MTFFVTTKAPVDNSLGRPTWEQPHEAWMNNLQSVQIQHLNTNARFANIANSQNSNFGQTCHCQPRDSSGVGGGNMQTPMSGSLIQPWSWLEPQNKSFEQAQDMPPTCTISLGCEDRPCHSSPLVPKDKIHQHDKRSITKYSVTLDSSHCPVKSTLYLQVFPNTSGSSCLDPTSPTHPLCHNLTQGPWKVDESGWRWKSSTRLNPLNRVSHVSKSGPLNINTFQDMTRAYYMGSSLGL